MKAIQLQQPGGLDKLEIVELPDPGQPGPSEIRVRIHASSLNFHDLGVVLGKAPTAQSWIPMSDGAGVVEAVGENVHEFRVGDKVVSTFFPDWISDEPTTANFSRTPGDGIDGYAREIVIAHFTAFTHAPRDYTRAEAATLTTAALTAWRALVVEGGIKAGDDVLVLGTGGVSMFALQYAKAMGARVVVTSSSREKLERAGGHGADCLITMLISPSGPGRFSISRRAAASIM